MDIKELISSNANLEDYLAKYGEKSEFLLAYYLQDGKRILNNYYSYSSYLTTNDKIKLLSNAIDQIDYNAINIVLNDIDINFVYDEGFVSIGNEIFTKLIELDKEGKIDITKVTGSISLYRSNPIYFVKKNPQYIRYFNNLKSEIVEEILLYLKSINYKFVENDHFFIEYNVINNPIDLAYLIDNFKYDSEIDVCIHNAINSLSKEKLVILYNNVINNASSHLIMGILSNLNYDNYDYNTIIKDRDLCLRYDEKKKNQIISLLEELNEKGFNANVVLVMNHVDMDFVHTVYNLIGNRLRISPVMNQVHSKYVGYYEIKNNLIYDYDYIKRSEEKLDLYASMVNDHLDRDGNIKQLSPLEKFIAAYIITTKFAPYKEEDINEDSRISRSIYEFINSVSGTKIVCVGYVHLLRELLYRMGITETMDWSVLAENTKSSNFNTDHARMMIHLKDSKYNIDGIYMSDPTWDEKGLTSDSVRHILMSHDELLKIDRNLSLEGLRANNYQEMESGLKVNDAYDMFRKPIPNDAIIKAYLAVNHFIDKNMKMVKNNEYDILEYSEMALKLNFNDKYRENRQQVLSRLENMPINEVMTYPNLFHTFMKELEIDLANKISLNINEDTFGPSIVIKETDNGLLLGVKEYFKSEDLPEVDLSFEDVQEIGKLIPNYKLNKMMSNVEFWIGKIDNEKSVNEQINNFLDKLQEYKNTRESITSQNEENKLK